ncbi:MAG: phosphopantothenoylcysteine decarboxylase [Rhodospirillales bacterium]
MWEHPAAQANPRHPARPRPSPPSVPTRATWPAASGNWPHGRARRHSCRHRARLAPPGAGRRGAGAGHQRADAREADRSVRFISNHSSGRRGTPSPRRWRGTAPLRRLVAGPTALTDPPGVAVPVETAAQMLAACEAALPVDVAVCAAAVGDWQVVQASPRRR